MPGGGGGDFIDPRGLDLLCNQGPLPRVILRPGRVPDNEVACLFTSADVACFPFESCTTSSSAVLALIVRDANRGAVSGCSCDLPDSVGWFYDLLDTQGLEDAMVAARTATTAELKSKSRSALEFAQSLSWEYDCG